MTKSSRLPVAVSTLCIALTTTERKEDAEAIARQLIDQNLVACVQIDGPITSIFRWEGKVNSAEEYLIMVTVPTEKATEVEAFVKSLHPYDTPEWIVIEVDKVSSGYLNWVITSTYEST